MSICCCLCSYSCLAIRRSAIPDRVSLFRVANVMQSLTQTLYASQQLFLNRWMTDRDKRLIHNHWAHVALTFLSQDLVGVVPTLNDIIWSDTTSNEHLWSSLKMRKKDKISDTVSRKRIALYNVRERIESFYSLLYILLKGPHTVLKGSPEYW